MFGGHLQFTLREVPTLLSHRLCLLFLFLVLMAFFATDPAGLRNYMAWWLSFLMWVIALAIYLSVHIATLVVYAALNFAFPRLPLFYPLLGLIALTPTVYATESIAHWLSGGTYPMDIIQNFVFFYIAAQVFENVFLRYAIPLVLQGNAPRSSRTAGTDRRGAKTGAHPRTLTIAERRIPIPRLRHIESQEHYVRVTLDNDQFMHRARLADLIAQTEREDGFQPHRSWWVSRAAGARLERRDGRHLLRLENGTEVPVARARLAQVQAWLDTHGAAEAAQAPTGTDA